MKQVKTMEQLKDSRLLFDKKVPAFGYMIILIVTISLAAVVVWSTFAKKSYMIIAKGTVGSENSNYVMPSYTGEIEKNYMKEGKVVEEGDVLFTIKSTDYNLQKQQLIESKESYETQIAQQEKLVKSIKDNTNYFDAGKSEDQLYYSSFEAYQSQVAQNSFDGSTYSAYGYTDEQIEKELEKNQGKLTEIYYTAIQSAENSIREAQMQIASIDAQLSAIGSGQEAYIVKAGNSGVLHMMADYKEGMVVQTGSAVASITEENAQPVVEAYVSTSDMARMKEGDKVQLAVDGLIQSVYGNIYGVVEQIDSNVTTQENSSGESTPVFKIRILPEVNYMVSKSGRKVNLANGMTVEARITYDEVTYFNYVLEKLGLLVR